MLTQKISSWLMKASPNFGLHVNHEMPVTLGCDIGLVRTENQDKLAILRVNVNSLTAPPFIAVALADGMGGMLDGSECAARTLGSFFNSLISHRLKHPKDRLLLATNAANESVHAYSNSNGGATLSAVVFDPDGSVFSVNVGDSRIYATTTDENEDEVMRLTIDDSLKELVGGSGRELLQFIGMGEGIDPHISEIPKSVEKIIITSDGAHFITPALFGDIVTNTDSQADTVEQLLTVAKWRGGPDNASVAAISKEGVLKSLASCHESGIQVWDCFGEFKIIWIKQEPMALKEPNVIHFESSETVPSPLNKADEDLSEVALKKTINRKKVKTRNKPKQSNLAQEPVFELIVETHGAGAGASSTTDTKDDNNSDNT